MSLINHESRLPPERLTQWPGYLLSRAHLRCHAAFQQALEPLQLTPKSFGALTVIAVRGPLSQTALGETTCIDRTTMVAVIDELEHAGYVERGRNSADRRMHSLEVTAAGQVALESAEEASARVHDEVLADLDTSERVQLAALLARVAG